MSRSISGAAAPPSTTTSSLNRTPMCICAPAPYVLLALGEETDTAYGRTPSIVMFLDPPSDSSEFGSGRSSMAPPMPAASLTEPPAADRASVPV